MIRFPFWISWFYFIKNNAEAIPLIFPDYSTPLIMLEGIIAKRHNRWSAVKWADRADQIYGLPRPDSKAVTKVPLNLCGTLSKAAEALFPALMIKHDEPFYIMLRIKFDSLRNSGLYGEDESESSCPPLNIIILIY